MNRLRMIAPLFRPRMQSIRNCETAATSAKKTSSAEKSAAAKLVKPTSMQKNYLLWSKMYKSAEEIPSEVSYTKLKRATDWARIRINIAMCVATLIGCMTMIYAGRKEHSWGKSLEKENLEWHAKVNQQAKDKAAAAAAK